MRLDFTVSLVFVPLRFEGRYLGLGERAPVLGDLLLDSVQPLLLRFEAVALLDSESSVDPCGFSRATARRPPRPSLLCCVRKCRSCAPSTCRHATQFPALPPIAKGLPCFERLSVVDFLLRDSLVGFRPVVGATRIIPLLC